MENKPPPAEHQSLSTIIELVSDSIFGDQHQFLSQVFVSSLVSVLQFHPGKNTNEMKMEYEIEILTIRHVFRPPLLRYRSGFISDRRSDQFFRSETR